MQADLKQEKFVFFKKPTSYMKEIKVWCSAIMFAAPFFVLVVLLLLYIVKMPENPSKPTVEKVIAEKAFAVENLNIFKYLSKTDLTQENLKKEFPTYKVLFEDYKPMVGWMEKENLRIHFDVSPEKFYISFNKMQVAQAYELKKALGSVPGYELSVNLDKESVNITVSNYNRQSEKKSSDAIDAQKMVLDMLKPVYPAELEARKNLEKMQDELAAMKINNLIVEEQIKQADLMKKLSQPSDEELIKQMRNLRNRYPNP